MPIIKPGETYEDGTRDTITIVHVNYGYPKEVTIRINSGKGFGGKIRSLKPKLDDANRCTLTFEEFRKLGLRNHMRCK